MSKFVRIKKFLGSVAILSPILFSPTSLLADDCIDWPKNLTWDDFKKNVPPVLLEAEKNIKDAKAAEETAEAAKGELKKKLAEKKKLLDEKNAKIDKINDAFAPKFTQLFSDRAKLMKTPDDIKNEAIQEVNNNKKINQNTKDNRIQGIEKGYKEAQKKFEDPKATAARNEKIAAVNDSIKKLETKKSEQREEVNKKFDKEFGPIIEKLDADIVKLQGEIPASGEAETPLEKAIKARNNLKLDDAETYAELRIEKDKTDHDCGKIKEIPVKARFCPGESYALDDIKKGRESTELLQHEQLHFDIAEKFARSLRQEVKQLVEEYNAEIDKLKKCDSKNQGDAVKSLWNKLNAKVDEAGEKKAADLAAEQGAYDKNPKGPPPNDGADHGRNKENQKVWSKKVSDALKASK